MREYNEFTVSILRDFMWHYPKRKKPKWIFYFTVTKPINLFRLSAGATSLDLVQLYPAYAIFPRFYTDTDRTQNEIKVTDEQQVAVIVVVE